jgi:hypothetical protein
VSLRVSTGTNRTGAPVTTSLLAPRLLEPAPSERIPVLLGSPVAARTSLAVGDPVTVTAEATPIVGVVAGIVPSLPSLTDGELVVADRPAVAARRLLDGRTVRAPTELLVSVAPGQRVEVAEILRAEPLDADVTDRREEALAAANDPVTVAVLGSLTFGALAAALVAAMGLLAGATADAWDRAGELAVLRALGMPLAGVRRILAGEAVLVVVVAVALGMTTGIVLGRIAVPALAIGRDGRPAVPEPAVVVPVVALALVAAVAGVIVAAMPLVAAAVQRRQRPAELLRMGDGA